MDSNVKVGMAADQVKGKCLKNHSLHEELALLSISFKIFIYKIGNPCCSPQKGLNEKFE
jgi:hypothetical protein